MVCERCGTVFCWDEADAGSVGGLRKRFCSKECKKRSEPSSKRHNNRYLRERASREARREHQLELCEEQDKKRYGDEPSAWGAAGRIYESKGDRPMYPYLCACGWWHLTKNPPRDGKIRGGVSKLDEFFAKRETAREAS